MDFYFARMSRQSFSHPALSHICLPLGNLGRMSGMTLVCKQIFYEIVQIDEEAMKFVRKQRVWGRGGRPRSFDVESDSNNQKRVYNFIKFVVADRR